MFSKKFDYDEYISFEDFYKELKIFAQDKTESTFQINLYSSGSDILSYKEFSDFAYTNLSLIYSLFNSQRKHINIVFNTRIPKSIENRTFQELFHNIPVEIQYYITEFSHINEVSFVDVAVGIKKLSVWTAKNPLRSRIVIDIIPNSNKFNDIKSVVSKSFIEISKTPISEFCLN